jgi:hypothetical protein
LQAQLVCHSLQAVQTLFLLYSVKVIQLDSWNGQGKELCFLPCGCRGSLPLLLLLLLQAFLL